MPTCYQCGKKFPSAKNLICHFRLMHKLTNNSEFHCVEQKCGRKYQKLNSFAKHLKTHVNAFDTIETNSDILQASTNSPTLSLNSEKTFTLHSLISCDVSDSRPNTSSQQKQIENSILNYDSLLSEFVAKIVSDLYSKNSLPRNAVQDIVTKFKDSMLLPLDILKNQLNLHGETARCYMKKFNLYFQKLKPNI